MHLPDGSRTSQLFYRSKSIRPGKNALTRKEKYLFGSHTRKQDFRKISSQKILFPGNIYVCGKFFFLNFGQKLSLRKKSWLALNTSLYDSHFVNRAFLCNLRFFGGWNKIHKGPWKSTKPAYRFIKTETISAHICRAMSWDRCSRIFWPSHRAIRYVHGLQSKIVPDLTVIFLNFAAII